MRLGRGGGWIYCFWKCSNRQSAFQLSGARCSGGEFEGSRRFHIYELRVVVLRNNFGCFAAQPNTLGDVAWAVRPPAFGKELPSPPAQQTPSYALKASISHLFLFLLCEVSVSAASGHGRRLAKDSKSEGGPLPPSQSGLSLPPRDILG